MKKILSINTSSRTDLFYITWLVTIFIFAVVVLIGSRLNTFPRDLQFLLVTDILTGIAVFSVALLSTFVDIIVSRLKRKKNEANVGVFCSREIAGIIIIITIAGSAYLGVKYLENNLPTEKSPSRIGAFRNTVPESIFTITEEELVIITNEQRTSNNLKPLLRNEYLDKAAKLKAEDMFQRNYWAHNAPDGTQPWMFFGKVGYSYLYAGENLAKDFYDSYSVVDSWMSSETHRENLLSPNFTEVGFGIKEGYLNGIKTNIVVQMLGTPMSKAQNNMVALTEETVRNHLNHIVSIKASWEINNDRYPREDINMLLDSFNRQVSFCNTILANFEVGNGNSPDNINLWNGVIKMSNETAVITNRLNKL